MLYLTDDFIAIEGTKNSDNPLLTTVDYFTTYFAGAKSYIMKNILLIAAALLSINASAQITLEHSYTNSDNIQVYNLEGEGYKYVITDHVGKTIRIYNTDHSLWKQISVSLPNGVSLFYVSYVSTKLFNADGNAEFLMSYYENISGTLKGTTHCIGDNGSVIYTFNDIASPYITKVGDAWKLMANEYISGSHKSLVYSLPGNYITTIRKTNSSEAETQLFPNPVETTATLRYNLGAGVSAGILSIYDMNGTKVRDYTITSDFQSISIERGTLPSGNYVYKVSTKEYGSVGERFTVK